MTMKKMISILSLFLLFVTQAHAQTASREEGVFLKVVGRGIQSKASNEVIALACVGHSDFVNERSCTQLQFVRIDSDSKAVTAIGPLWSLPLDHEPTANELQKYVKTLNRKIRQYRIANQDREVRNAFITFGAIVGGVVLAATITPACLLLFFPSIALNMTLNSVPIFGKSGSVSNTMADQNGWNWSSRPKRISAKRFDWVVRALGGKDPVILPGF
jgi:hypothetical protein